MRQVEKSARTIEEAVSLALHELGVSRDQVTVEILEEPSKGFLGFGSREATVRVRYQEPLTASELLRLDVAETLQAQAQVDKPARIKELLEHICAAMGLKVQAQVTLADDRLLVDVHGPNAGMLIGHHGQTLDSLQLLLNMAGAKLSEDGIRIHLDVEGYRKRREATLIRLAAEKAEQVRQSGRKVLLEPMNAQERRIVHMALQDYPDIGTESEGEEPFRRVVITPKS